MSTAADANKSVRSFVVDGYEGCYLFTGDTLLLGTDSPWFAGYIPSVSNHDELVESLGVVSEVSPHVVIFERIRR